MAVQFEAYLTTGLWRRNAEHSNQMAQLLYAELQSVPQVKVMYPVQVNSVFAQLPRDVWKALQQDYFFYDWQEGSDSGTSDSEADKNIPKDVVRWMCSFDTTVEDIKNFVAALRNI